MVNQVLLSKLSILSVVEASASFVTVFQAHVKIWLIQFEYHLECWCWFKLVFWKNIQWICTRGSNIIFLTTKQNTTKKDENYLKVAKEIYVLFFCNNLSILIFKKFRNEHMNFDWLSNNSKNSHARVPIALQCLV